MLQNDLEKTLKRIAPGSVVIPIRQVTEGAACTVILVEKYTRKR